ncbi:MAG: 6-bladed beta-propeller [Rhodothermaceae bacterium]|nr:6-bladed beta-propeller [Rhodothermaceae bacterium]MYF40099.1 6-bladed beta-propeller [Rhodothermaceae bacterium]
MVNWKTNSISVVVACAFAPFFLIFSVVLISTANGMLMQGQGVTLNEASRIGDEAAGDTMLLGGVIQVSADSEGKVYVVESSFSGIHVFSAVGDHITSIGRSGVGPGEFQNPPQIYVGRNDTLYAFDFWPRRLSVFSPESHKLEYSLSLGSSNDACPPTSLLGVEPEGYVLICSESVASPSEAHMTRYHRVYVQNRAGRVVSESIAVLPVREELIHTTHDTMQFHSLRYGRSPHFVYALGGSLYYAWNDAISIQVVGLNGTLQNEIKVSHEPVQVIRKERDDALAYYRTLDPPFDNHARARLPATKPAFSYFLVDDLDRLWISQSLREDVSETEWLIVDQQGQVIASTMLSNQMRPMRIRGNRVYGRLIDSDTRVHMVVVWDMAIH